MAGKQKEYITINRCTYRAQWLELLILAAPKRTTALRRLWDEGEAATVVDAAAVELQTHSHGGERLAKADTVTSKMVASDRRAMAGGEMDVPTAANRAVVAEPWEEEAEEHGSDVLVVGW